MLLSERAIKCYPPCCSDDLSVVKITHQHGGAAHLLLAIQAAREISTFLSVCLSVCGVKDRSVSVTESAVFSAEGGERSM
jgi:hypothetical protein